MRSALVAGGWTYAEDAGAPDMMSVWPDPPANVSIYVEEPSPGRDYFVRWCMGNGLKPSARMAPSVGAQPTIRIDIGEVR
jgi:hypothetical protein